MCFSAGASFATAAALLPAGAYCVRRAWLTDRDRLPLAVLPAVFGAQQCFEGLVWIGLERGDPDLVRFGALAFLLFALVFWPFWIPICALFLDTRRRVRWWKGLLAAVGLAGGLLVYVPLAAQAVDRLRAGILHHSIRYEFEVSPALSGIPLAFWQTGYIALVTAPLLLTGRRGYKVFGVLLLLAAIVSHAAFWYAFISVWCAFAALLSGWLCLMFFRPPVPLRTSAPSLTARGAILILGLLVSGAPALAQSPSPPAAAPPLGRGHAWLHVGRVDLDDAAAREWGVSRADYLAVAGYRGDARGFAYFGGEIGHSGEGEARNSSGETIRDFDLFWIDLNAKWAFDLGHGWSADAGLGTALFYVDGEESTVEGGEEFRDPLADIGFGTQILVDVTWRTRHLLMGVDARYQWAFDLIDIDYSNLRLGVHVGFAF